MALKKRADGRCVKSIIDPRTGKRKYFYGKNEREIDRKIMAYNGEVERGRTFEEVADDWWEEARPKLAMQSVRGYQCAVDRAVAHFGETPIKNITPRDINIFLGRLASQYAQKTLANQRMVVNLICNYAVLNNDIIYNPCASVQPPKGRGKTTRQSASTSDEQIVLANAEKYPMPYMALMTGMRRGEILALTWGDIDFERNIIHVNKSLAHNGDRPVIKPPKTEAGIRLVPLLDPLKNLLLSMRGKAKDSDLVISDNGKPFTNRRLITVYSHIQRDLGITCTMHQLRHSFATVAFELGLQPKAIQEILGHKQISTTMDIYTDFRQNAVIEATQKLNNQLVKLWSK